MTDCYGAEAMAELGGQTEAVFAECFRDVSTRRQKPETSPRDRGVRLVDPTAGAEESSGAPKVRSTETGH